MGLPVRVAFDPALPCFASQAFTAGGRPFTDGDPFPWRDIGVDETSLASFWRSGLVHFTAAPVITPRAAPPQQHKRR